MWLANYFFRVGLGKGGATNLKVGVNENLKKMGVHNLPPHSYGGATPGRLGLYIAYLEFYVISIKL